MKIDYVCIYFCDCSRDDLTKDDIKVYAAVLDRPGDSYPNATKWYDSVSAHLAPRLAFFFFTVNYI